MCIMPCRVQLSEHQQSCRSSGDRPNSAQLQMVSMPKRHAHNVMSHTTNGPWVQIPTKANSPQTGAKQTCSTALQHQNMERISLNIPEANAMLYTTTDGSTAIQCTAAVRPSATCSVFPAFQATSRTGTVKAHALLVQLHPKSV